MSNSQSAFIKGSQITDRILVANECVDSWKNSFAQGLICKGDLEKAFDHVNWGFLEWVLLKKK